jgi:imidazolonepropionase-like amidohydrolase
MNFIFLGFSSPFFLRAGALLPSSFPTWPTSSTTVEIKSGYGLDLNNELKMLRVAHKAKEAGIMGIVSTYAGGNAVQKGMKEEEAAKQIVEVHLEEIKVENYGLFFLN